MTDLRRNPQWFLLEAQDIGRDGDPYLDRLRIIGTPLFSLYLHHFHRPDAEPDPHDHPWWFTSLILTGVYEEATWPDKRNPGACEIRTRTRGSLRCMSRRSAHRITVTHGSVWTLILTGPKRSSWGFWPDGRYVPWRDYMKARRGAEVAR
jgi:hypothetical protein